MDPIRELRTFSARQVRAEPQDDGQIRLTGYAAVFNELSVPLWGYRERIDPGAFDETLKANPDVRFLLNHDGLPLARTRSGTLELWADSQGLGFRALLDETDPDVQRTVPKVRRGDLDQMSFAFWIVGETPSVENGEQIRTLTQIDLDDGDVSLVTYPAYPQTEAHLREMRAAYDRTRAAAQGSPAGEPTEPDEWQGPLDVARRRLDLENARMEVQ